MNQKLLQVLSLTALTLVGVSGFNSVKAVQSCSTCVSTSTCMQQFNTKNPTCKGIKDVDKSAVCVYEVATEQGACLQKECSEACSTK